MTERIVAGSLFTRLFTQEFNGSTFKCIRKCGWHQCAPELGANVNADSVERRLADMSHDTVPKADMPKMAYNWWRGLPIGAT